jgi:hypothetical protein
MSLNPNLLVDFQKRQKKRDIFFDLCVCVCARLILILIKSSNKTKANYRALIRMTTTAAA